MLVRIPRAPSPKLLLHALKTHESPSGAPHSSTTSSILRTQFVPPQGPLTPILIEMSAMACPSRFRMLGLSHAGRTQNAAKFLGRHHLLENPPVTGAARETSGPRSSPAWHRLRGWAGTLMAARSARSSEARRSRAEPANGPPRTPPLALAAVPEGRNGRPPPLRKGQTMTETNTTAAPTSAIGEHWDGRLCE